MITTGPGRAAERRAMIGGRSRRIGNQSELIQVGRGRPTRGPYSSSTCGAQTGDIMYIRVYLRQYPLESTAGLLHCKVNIP